MRLAELQAAYRDYLLTGDAAPLAPAIVADAFDAAERLAIYRNNFTISLTEALKANFPVTQQLLGADFFAQAARRFVTNNPPRRPCLFEYGAAFPDHLRALPQLAALPYVAEVARFEFARIAAYNAPVERAITAQELAGLAPERLDGLVVRRARHARLLAASAPVLALWTAHQSPDPELSNLDTTARPHVLLVCRPQRTLVVRELEPPAARFLAAADEATTLGLLAARSGAEGAAALGAIVALALELKLLVAPVGEAERRGLSAPA